MTTEKLKRVPHFFSAAIILLHALERFESGHHAYLIFLLCGIIFFSLAVFHHRIAHRMPRIDIAFYSIESLLCFIIAAEYFSAGKRFAFRLPDRRLAAVSRGVCVCTQEQKSNQ